MKQRSIGMQVMKFIYLMQPNYVRMSDNLHDRYLPFNLSKIKNINIQKRQPQRESPSTKVLAKPSFELQVSLIKFE